MARKKIDNVEVVELKETKDVSFSELELKIAKPSLNADKTLNIKGNFEELGTKITALVEKYKDTILTEDNVSYVKTLKGHFTSLRTGIERERKEYKKVYITPAGKLVDSMCDELQKIVAQGENALAIQLEEYDQKRKEELTVILTGYVEDAVVKYELREEYASKIVLLEKYYNKTQHEEDSADDIERQARELKKQQTDYDSSVLLITAECEEAGFLPDTYLRELAYKSTPEIILEIKADKKAKEEIKKEIETENPPVITVGADISEELEKALVHEKKDVKKEEKRVRVLRIEYLPEQASLISQFFKSNGILFEFLNTNF